MKLIALTLGTVLSFSGMASAKFNYETSRMESGSKFAERQMDNALAERAAPVEISGDFAPVKPAEYTGEAKNHARFSMTPPPVPKSEEGKEKEKKGRTGEIIGASVGGAGAGVVAMGLLAAAPWEAAAVGTMIAAGGMVVGVAAVGAAVGFGVVYAVKKLRE